MNVLPYGFRVNVFEPIHLNMCHKYDTAPRMLSPILLALH